MANPQPDLHTKISNEILEHLMTMPLSGNQWQVLICIIRKTYGFHKKQDYLTNSQIIEATGLGKTVVSRCLTLLQKGNFIIRNGHVTGLQKDWEQWQPELTKQSTKVSYLANNSKPIVKVSKLDNSTGDEKLANQVTELANQVTKVSYSLDTQKKKETIQKKYILPEWISRNTWDAFLEMRKKKKAPVTDYAAELIIKKLEAFKNQGADPNGILNQSIEHTWTGIFRDKRTKYRN
jgi:phage replication O-like protein O